MHSNFLLPVSTTGAMQNSKYQLRNSYCPRSTSPPLQAAFGASCLSKEGLENGAESAAREALGRGVFGDKTLVSALFFLCPLSAVTLTQPGVVTEQH